MKRLTAWTIIAAVLAGGCGGGNWTEKFIPKPTASYVVKIESDKPDERREALQKVAADSSARRIPSVVKLFCLVARTDKDTMVRSAAVRGLAVMEGDEVLSTLGGVATKDDSPYVRSDAVVSLGQQAKPEAAAPLIQVLQGDGKPDVRVAAAESLRHFKDKAALQALIGGLGDTSLAVAQKAWESLRYMTGQNMPRMAQPWEDFLASSENPFEMYGKPPPMPKGQSQRPQFTKGPMDLIKGMFAKDVREAELE